MKPAPHGSLVQGAPQQTESAEEMHLRLLALIAASRLEVLAEDFGWLPLQGGHPPSALAIACVRDGEVWHQLLPVPADHPGPCMCVVSFHFPAHIHGAGFIAWLAAWIKREAGTGVVVIGGKDSNPSAGLDRGSFGVFDYWCCDAADRARFLAVIDRLVAQGRTAWPSLPAGGPAPGNSADAASGAASSL